MCEELWPQAACLLLQYPVEGKKAKRSPLQTLTVIFCHYAMKFQCCWDESDQSNHDNQCGGVSVSAEILPGSLPSCILAHSSSEILLAPNKSFGKP